MILDGGGVWMIRIRILLSQLIGIFIKDNKYLIVMGEGVIDFYLFGMGSLMSITNMIVSLFVYGMDRSTTKQDVFYSRDILHKKIGTRN